MYLIYEHSVVKGFTSEIEVVLSIGGMNNFWCSKEIRRFMAISLVFTHNSYFQKQLWVVYSFVIRGILKVNKGKDSRKKDGVWFTEKSLVRTHKIDL